MDFARPQNFLDGTEFPAPLRFENRCKPLKTRVFLVCKTFLGSTNVLLPHFKAPAENSEVELAFSN